MSKHDIVVLSEIHRATVNKHAPGFIPIVADNESSNHRGGVVVLFKYSIYSEVYSVDKSVPEQVWFRLRSVPNVQFCGAYGAPSDTPYFKESSLAELQAKSCDGDKHYVIVGDMNARCGNNVQQLVQRHSHLKYNVLDDCVNDNGRQILQICEDNSLLVLNNLESERVKFTGGLSFRRKKKWISEIDLCILSQKLLDYTKSLHVSHDVDFPSDHAPVTAEFHVTPDLIHPRELCERAENTSGHAVLSCDAHNPLLCRKAIPSHNIHPVKFHEHLEAQVPPPVGNEQCVESLCCEFSDAIYRSATQSKLPPAVTPTLPDLSRWQRIINCDDPKILWQAIDWKGEFNPAPNKDRPSDVDFQTHIETLLNPSELQDDNWPTFGEQQVTIPLLDDPINSEEMETVINKQLKPGKQAGPDGNSPGTFHMLPASWMLFLLSLLNTVFYSNYPVAWTRAKLSMLFKKGDSMDTGNYRGISIIDSIRKKPKRWFLIMAPFAHVNG